MKKIAKKLLLLALSTMLVGAGTTAVYNVYNEEPAITASAEAEVKAVATFEFGKDGGGTTESSSEKTTYTETQNGYTLNLSNGSKIYPNSYDTNGKAAIKLGTGSAYGSFTFTVPDDVLKVEFQVAGRLAKTAAVSINGGDKQVISQTSNAKTEATISVDTSSNKTVKFATVAGGGDKRAFLYSITYYVAAAPEVEEGATDEKKVQAELDALTLPGSVEIEKTIELNKAGLATPDVAIAWTLEENACASIETGDLVITNPEANTVVKLEASASLNGVTLTKKFSINVKSAASFLAEEVAALEVVASLESGATAQLPVKGTKHANTTIAWALAETEDASLNGNVLSAAEVEDDATVTLTATFALAGVEVEKEYTVNVVWSPALARFTLGADGTATHYDGTSKTSYTETSGDYTLSITGGKNMYTGARDAKGNSCIKLGTGSAVASFSFTVSEDVNRVVFKVAGYKSNLAKIKVNDATYDIATKSDNGEYTDVVVDTSVNKTISFETVSSNPDERAMINEIVYEKTFALTTITGNQRLDPSCVTTTQYGYGDEISVQTPTAEGKDFAGWIDVNSNPVTLPETMPKYDVTVYASWDIIPYTLTIVNGETSTEFVFGVEAAGDIMLTPADLAYVLADNLPADTDEFKYSWVESIPETFALQDYTFTVLETNASVPVFVVTVVDGDESKQYNVEQGGEICLDTPVAEGKTFAGWVDAEGNACELPETMPANDLTVYVSWTINAYTLTIVNGEDATEFSFGVETTDAIALTPADLAAVLAENLPKDTADYNYEWVEEIPEMFALKDYTFTVQATYLVTEMTISEALQAADGTRVKVSGTVCEVNTAWSDQYNNITVTIADADGNKLYVYRMATYVELGDIITIIGNLGSYNGKQIQQGSTAVITGHDSSYDYVEMSIVDALAAADGANVIVEGTVKEIETAYSSQYGNISVYIVDENGTRLYLYRLSGEVKVGQIIKVKGTMATYKEARQLTGGTFELLGEHTCKDLDTDTDHKCEICDKVLSDCADNNDDHKCEICGTVLTQCTDNNNDHNCDLCGGKVSDCADNDNNHNCDICDAILSECADNDNNHACDVCGATLSQCADNDNNHKCDVCDKTLTVCADSDTDDDHNCDVCGRKLNNCADNNNDHNCDVCGTELSQCADNDKDHNCDVCGTELSQCADNNNDHNCDVCDATLTQCVNNNADVDHNCDICGAVIDKCISNDNNHDCDVCGKEGITVCESKDNNHECDICGKKVDECEDADLDHDCDFCGVAMGTHEAAEGKHTCDYCGKKVTECADNNNDHYCEVCSEKVTECADADNNHNCDICGTELSQCADNNNDHNCDICGTELSQCADNDNNHECDVCGITLSVCADADKDHECDVCGITLSVCADADNNHKCDVCDAILSQCVNNDNNHVCDICGETLSECADADNNHVCDICGETLSECADADNDHNCDVCDAVLSECADADNDHNCDVCESVLSECADADNDHECDVCEAVLSECADADNDHNCDVCDAVLSECADADNDHECDVCEAVLSECADADDDHNCDVCGEKVSEHNYVDGVCSVCGGEDPDYEAPGSSEEPGTSEEPEVPGSSEEPGTSEEPEVPGSSEEPEVPGSSEEPSSSEKPSDSTDSEEPEEPVKPSIFDRIQNTIPESIKAVIPGCSGVVGGIAGGVAALGIAVVALLKKKEDKDE